MDLNAVESKANYDEIEAYVCVKQHRIQIKRNRLGYHDM